MARLSEGGEGQRVEFVQPVSFQISDLICPKRAGIFTSTNMATGVDSVPIPGAPTSGNVDPTPSSTSAPQVHDQEEQYDMSGLRKAFVLCIKENRSGAENELKILKNLLEELNFQVSKSINPNGKDILVSLKKYRDDMESRVCCSFVFILAHGKEGQICGSDNADVDLEDIFKMFNNEECPHLQYKPKVFVVQACRGNKKDSGVPSGFRSMEPEPELLPTVSDTFTVYPSQPGFVAYRNTTWGSYMLQEMEKVFKNLADKKHLYDLFVKVNQELVKKTFYPDDKAKTSLVMESTLTKSVYLKVPKP